MIYDTNSTFVLTIRSIVDYWRYMSKFIYFKFNYKSRFY